jgi:hypothetical protein
VVSKDTYDFEAKRAYRQAWADFIMKHYPSEHLRRDLQVLCLPGHEGLEVTEVYLPLGFRPENIFGVERDREALNLLTKLDLGINIVEGEMLDFLKYSDPSLTFDIANFDFTGRASAFCTVSPIMSFFERNRLSKFRRTLLGTTFWAGMERIPEQRKLVLAAVQYYVLSNMVLNKQFFDPQSLLNQIGKILPGVFSDPETGNTYLRCSKAEKWAIQSMLFSLKKDLSGEGKLLGYFNLELHDSLSDVELPFSELKDIRDVGITWLVLACAHLPKDSWALHELNETYGQKCNWDESDTCNDECRFVKKAFASISNLKLLIRMSMTKLFEGVFPCPDIQGSCMLHHAKATGIRFIEDIERFHYVNDKGSKLLVDFFAFDPKREWLKEKYDVSFLDLFMEKMERQADSLMNSPSLSAMQIIFEEFSSLSRKQLTRIHKRMKSTSRLTTDPKIAFAQKLIPYIPQRMDILNPDNPAPAASNPPESVPQLKITPEKLETSSSIPPAILEEVKFWVGQGEKPEEILRAYPDLSSQQLTEVHRMVTKEGFFSSFGKMQKKLGDSPVLRPPSRKRRKSR